MNARLLFLGDVGVLYSRKLSGKRTQDELSCLSLGQKRRKGGDREEEKGTHKWSLFYQTRKQPGQAL
jgi:hypothetical protein